jgi:flagellin
VHLLDGLFGGANGVFQVGANAGETINISSITNMQTAQLGNSISYSASVTGSATTAALNNGDLTLNSIQVGASQLGAAPGQSAASAFSIAAAIHAVSASSGVDATANSNIVTGTGAAITTFTSIAANTFSINGVNVGATVAGGNAAGQGANVATAINLVATQTGVTASANASTGALTLTAADGRDISISLLGTAADAATAAANKTAFLAQTGLTTGNVGTQAVAGGGGVSQTVGISNSGTFVTVPGGNGTITNLTASVNGGAFVNLGPIAENPGGSWMNIWTAIEAQFPGAVGQFSHQLFTNGGNTIRFAIGGSAPDAATASANQSTLMTQTGLSAAQLGSQAVAGAMGVAAVAADNHGTVTLSSTSASGIVLGGNAVASGGFTAGTINATATSSNIASLDVQTAASATNAITTIDTALATVNAARANLGAIQNRFASVVSTLQTTSENLSAAKSRIMDTDFAAETANMTRGNILQQAGTAMLAQANQLPSMVLSLLK